MTTANLTRALDALQRAGRIKSAWLPGMRSENGYRCIADDESWSHPPNATNTADSGGTNSGASSNCRLYTPDLTDTATIFCLLALLRESCAATGAATVTVEPDDRLSPGTGWDCYAWWPGARSELIATGPSEAAAIAAAVIAAADEPVGAPRHA